MGVSIWLLYDGFFSFAVVWQFLNQHDRLLVGSAAYPIRIESCHALIVPIHRLRYEKPIFDVLQGLLIFGNVLVCHFLRPLERALAGFGHCVLVGHFLKSFLFLFQPFLVLVIRDWVQ